MKPEFVLPLQRFHAQLLDQSHRRELRGKGNNLPLHLSGTAEHHVTPADFADIGGGRLVNSTQLFIKPHFSPASLSRHNHHDPEYLIKRHEWMDQVAKSEYGVPWGQLDRNLAENIVNRANQFFPLNYNIPSETSPETPKESGTTETSGGRGLISDQSMVDQGRQVYTDEWKAIKAAERSNRWRILTGKPEQVVIPTSGGRFALVDKNSKAHKRTISEGGTAQSIVDADKKPSKSSPVQPIRRDPNEGDPNKKWSGADQRVYNYYKERFKNSSHPDGELNPQEEKILRDLAEKKGVKISGLTDDGEQKKKRR